MLKDNFIFFLLLFAPCLLAQSSYLLLDSGWNELKKDNDMKALIYFQKAYSISLQEKDIESKAKSLLYLGIASYGSSLNNGLDYGLQSINEYKKLEQKYPLKALEGYSKCLQLMSTIKNREGKTEEAMALSKEALQGFEGKHDTTGTVILIYNSIASTYEKLKLLDSAAYYYKEGLNEALRNKNNLYLPNAYLKVAKLAYVKSEKESSLILIQRSLTISDSTENKQAAMASLLALGNWYKEEADHIIAETYYRMAKKQLLT